MPNVSPISQFDAIARATPASVPSPTKVRSAFFGSPHRFLDIGHSRLAYRRFGQGPDVVFVHGWPLHSATFRAIVPELAEQFTCHLVDLPGTGQTETGADAPIDLASHARTLRAAVDVLGLQSYALLSHDSGGVMARLLAADDARVDALIVSGSEIPGHRARLVELLARIARTPGGASLLRLSLQSRRIQRSSLGFGGCFHDLRALEGDFRTLFIEPLIRSRQALEGQLALARNLDFRVVHGLASVHARIHAPVLLLWGADDPFFPAAKAAKMIPQFGGGGEFVALPSAKLFVHEEHPIEFARRSRAFLLAHSSRRTAGART